MATTEERLSSNWPPAFPAIRFHYQSQGNGVYRIWQPEILEAAPVVPADQCGLVTEDICLGEILAMAGLPEEGVWAGYAEPGEPSTYTAWRVG